MSGISGPVVAISATGQQLALGPPGPQGPQGPQGIQGVSGTPTALRVAGTGTVQAIVGATVFADPGGGTPGSPTITVPSGPQDAGEFKVTDTTGTANGTTRKIGISPAGAHIEDPQALGTFPTTTVYMVVAAATHAWAWDAVQAHWKLVL